MSSNTLGYFGPYRLLNVVNMGQTSRLWQAYHDQERQFVGIKTLLDQFAKEKDQVQLLKWEFEVATKFNHPKLIRFIELAWQQKTPYLVMEWFSAPNLKMWINRGYEQYCTNLPKLILDTTESVQYMHEQKWVHRDIKPDNFLFSDENKEIRLIDFALSKRVVGGLGRIFSLRAKPQGTASYMSPEQIRGLPPDIHADIYSLGCTFYEMITTKLPFTGETINDLLNKHLKAPPPVITARNKNVTPEFANVIKSMLAKEVADRPKTTTELLQHLRGIRLFRRPPSAADLQ
ncbi:MAG: serine/threonine protein kinase [Thermoguttaceae bacterium]